MKILISLAIMAIAVAVISAVVNAILVLTGKSEFAWSKFIGVTVYSIVLFEIPVILFLLVR